ncbi:MAG: glycosyl transferase family protein [uncultured bacterium]|nr:MAG: glycosyl transferase family protein [uncultured bacterium]HBR71239.1 hypothetical protein [Candidatus Moranbacteria bacterium]
MQTYPKVFAIVLNYNGKDSLIPCLDSIYRSSYPNLEIIVIDNNSKDGSFEQAKEKFQKFHFIKNSQNLGFGAGNNVAIRFALEKMADYVFLLNNDALVEKDAIDKLVNEAEKNPRNGILSPLILSGNKKDVWFAGGKILWNKMRTIHLYKTLSSNPYPTEYISGCAMLIRQKVFEEIGLFDEQFFLYYEDADLSIRACRHNFSLLMVPQAIAYHFEKSEQLNPQKLYWLVLSAVIFFKKNSTWTKKLWIIFYIFLRKMKNWFNLRIKKTEQALQIQRAFQDYKKTAK